MKTMAYKRFKGTVEWSHEDKCYFGKLLDIRGLVSFEGDRLEELERDFKEAVDNYIYLKESKSCPKT
ncbi:MAG TPA: antitoxin HicB [Spirochaetes bacterium]|nr:antitoxin HicB [Spirochaetota bacterium]